jgi:uncharacterized integral membrane protein (TIGR00698 family)
MKKKLPGLLVVLGLSIIAAILGNLFPLVGAAVFGILLGIFLNSVFKVPALCDQGIAFSAKKILQFSIILLGGTLSIGQILKIGGTSFSVLIFTLTAAYVTAYFVGKKLGVPQNLIRLIGSGTAICGGSAIAAVSSVVQADEHDVAYAISTIFLFNILAVLLFPAIGHLLHLSNYGFGLFAGTAINDTSSVVAAGYTYSNIAGDYATIVKLTRTTLIIPICIGYMIAMLRAHHKASVNVVKIFPWFLLGFLSLAGINSLGGIPAQLIPTIKESAKFMIVMALVAIGLKTNIRKMIATGPRPMLLGLSVWLAVTATSLGVQLLSGQL